MLLNYFYVTIMALIVGSFLNLLIYRLPIMLQNIWQHECAKLLSLPSQAEARINLFLPRSFCPQCKTTIKAFDNIPILSFILLNGRCGQCGNLISLRYPVVEGLSCILALLAAWHFGFNVTFVFALLFIWITIALFFIDLEQQLLPDSLTLGLLWLGLIANAQSLFIPLPIAVFSASGAYLFLWLFIKLFDLVTGKIGMGNGDFKLFAAFGAWFGWLALPLILICASIGGVLVGSIYLKIQGKTKDTPIPFGPFLCVAGVLSLFWGRGIINWYLD